MPTLDSAPPSFVKAFLIGDSGAGKTGSLTSLVTAGYSLYIVDLDDGLMPLAQQLRAAKADMSKVHYVTLADEYRNAEVRRASAYQRACKMLTAFGDKDEETIDPSALGPDAVFIIDSFTLLGRSALAHAKMADPANKDPRRWFFAAQQACENYLACLFSKEFAVNVLVLTHITDVELNDGTKRGFPSAIGTALSRHVGKYANNIFVVETKGVGANTRRIIRTVANGQTDAKTAAVGLDKELPIESGLATIFEKLRG